MAPAQAWVAPLPVDTRGPSLVLQKLAEEKSLAKIGIAELVDARITNGRELVKILGDGELKAKLEVEANAFSKSAEEAIKAVGGKTTII